MNWLKVSIRLSDIPRHKELYNYFSKIYKENREPDDLKLYQADPDYYVDYYISIVKEYEFILKGLVENFNAVKVDKPDLSNLFLTIGQKKIKDPKLRIYT